MALLVLVVVAMKNTQPLEKYFTVVNWDQRRAGKSFAAGRADAEMTIGTFVDDLIALSSDLARRFHKNKILLVGHSWGSVIGVIAASRRPDLFSVPHRSLCPGSRGEDTGVLLFGTS